MRTIAKGLLVTLALLLVGLSAAPAQARFFVGFGFGYPGFYRPYPVFYRPYLPPPPPPPVVIEPRPIYYAPPPVVYREPAVYRSVYYRYSRPLVRHHRHRVVYRRSCGCRY